MTMNKQQVDVALGVECAWPAFLAMHPSATGPRQRRLTDAWRRIMAVLQPKRRASWAR